MAYVISTIDAAATQEVAARLAKLLNGGEVIELASDLGGGKTTFVQGLVAGLGYDGEVTSPTFVLSRIYKIRGSLELHHYDLYRLGISGVVGEEIAEDLSDENTITVIEWADIVEDELPADRLQIKFVVTGDTTRDIDISFGGPMSERIVKELQA